MWGYNPLEADMKDCIWRAAVSAVSLFAACGAASPVAAQTGGNVLVVVNDASSTGDAIAKRYAERRGVPGANICRIVTTLEETIERASYAQQIETPVWKCIARQAAQDLSLI